MPLDYHTFYLAVNQIVAVGEGDTKIPRRGAVRKSSFSEIDKGFVRRRSDSTPVPRYARDCRTIDLSFAVKSFDQIFDQSVKPFERGFVVV
jgi:hypothetical protein